MSVITVIFNLLALLYIGRALMLVARIVRDWAAIRQEPLTGAKQHLAEQAAFFVAVPLSVLVHEGAHALFVLLFGGQIIQFGYRVFWGFVSYQAAFTPTQSWIVAIAGTLGSLAFGLAVWLLSRHNPSRTLRYFGLRAFRFQIYFSLLYYPIMTLFLSIGDWRTIYSFGATPLLSGLTLLAHAGLLLWFWRADQAGAFEMPAFESLEAQRYSDQVAASGDPARQQELIQLLQRGGAPKLARRRLDAFLAANPQSAEGHLQRALLLAQGRSANGRAAAEAARQAAALGLSRPPDAALARQLAALYELERGDGRAAQIELDAALTPAPGYDPEHLNPLNRAELHKLRGQAYRRQRRYDDAYREIGLALQLAEGAPPAFVASLREEKELIEVHAGQELSPQGR